MEFKRQQTATFLGDINSLLKAYTAIVFSILLILINNVVFLVVLNGFALCLLFLAKLSLKQLASVFAIIFLSLYGIVFTQGLFYQIEPRTTVVSLLETSLFGLPVHLRLTREGMAHGLIVALRLIGPLILTFLIYVSTSSESFLKSFRRLGLPQAINLMLITAIRFLPMIFSDYQIVRANQKLLGYRPSLFRPLYTMLFELNMVKPLFFNAVRNSVEVAYAMMGRGFSNRIQKQHRDHLFTGFEWLYVSLLTVFILTVIMFKLLYFLYLNQIYYQSDFRRIYEICRYFL
jgi:energy-coupling factor transport system permease protein